MSDEAKGTIESFDDLEGRTWRPRMRGGAIIKTCDETGLTISDLTTYNVPVGAFFLLVWHSIKKQADERGLDRDAFEDGLGPKEIAKSIQCVFSIIQRDFGGVGGPLFNAVAKAAGLDLGTSETSSSSPQSAESIHAPQT